MTQAPTHITDPPWLTEAEASLPSGSLRRIAALAMITISLGFGGLITWAALSRVESAIPGTGAIVSDGKRKTVSLVESGVLRELVASEGSRVVEGQVLFRLDDVQVRTARAQASVLYWSAVARAARLTAESADKRDLQVAAETREAAALEPAIAAAVAAESLMFRTRWAALDAFVLVQHRKIAQQKAHIESLRAQIDAVTIRRRLLQDELRDTVFLMARGLSTRPHELELRRADAEMMGQIGQLEAQMNESSQAIAQIEAETINMAESRRSDIARESAETQAARADAAQRLNAAEDLLRKRVITAPEAGTVTDIRLFTPGSSIQAGQPVMDLVPETGRLLVEAKVAPLDVGHLAIGQHVNVRLTSYKAHQVPVIPGRLTYVGADRQVDTNNQAFFLVRAEIESDALRTRPKVVLSPGMPADVLIVNGARSVLDFLISPITDSIQHAMREE